MLYRGAGVLVRHITTPDLHQLLLLPGPVEGSVRGTHHMWGSKEMPFRGRLGGRCHSEQLNEGIPGDCSQGPDGILWREGG